MGATRMEKQSQTPEALRSIGTPWLLSHDLAGARKDSAHWHVPGFGFVLRGQCGDMLACAIPGELALERGPSMDYCITFLTLLPWKEFDEFMRTHCQFALLTPGRALWVGAVRLALHSRDTLDDVA